MSLDDDFVRRKEEISETLETKLDSLKKEIVEEVAKIIEAREKIDPYTNLKEILEQAMREIVKEKARAIQEGKKSKTEEIERKEEHIRNELIKIEGIVEQIKKEDESSISQENPFYPDKWYERIFPFIKQARSHERSARNWIALLFAGISLGLIFTGIGEAATSLQSIQGSIILGTIILALLAWLEKRKVFSLLGQE